jgi:hypothetical protein
MLTELTIGVWPPNCRSACARPVAVFASIVSNHSFWVQSTDCVLRDLSPTTIRPDCCEGSLGSVPVRPQPAVTATVASVAVHPISRIRTSNSLPFAEGLPTTVNQLTHPFSCCCRMAACGGVRRRREKRRPDYFVGTRSNPPLASMY